MDAVPGSALGRFVNGLEEGFIALAMGLMTAITFANVVARYVFNSNILWALETTVFIFAWLVLIGASYLVKTHGHLGVDILINAVDAGKRRILALAAVVTCLVFSVLLLIGAWQYWLPFFGKNAWYETTDIPMLEWLRWIEPLVNENERYDKLPRFIPYFALPLGITLITFRFVQIAWRIWKGEIDRVVASHEAEDLVEEAASRIAADEAVMAKR